MKELPSDLGNKLDKYFQAIFFYSGFRDASFKRILYQAWTHWDNIPTRYMFFLPPNF